MSDPGDLLNGHGIDVAVHPGVLDVEKGELVGHPR